jgi:hypothetical protein
MRFIELLDGFQAVIVLAVMQQLLPDPWQCEQLCFKYPASHPSAIYQSAARLHIQADGLDLCATAAGSHRAVLLTPMCEGAF